MQIARILPSPTPSRLPFAPASQVRSRFEILDDEREFAEIWPACPLAIDAYDLADLGDPRTVDTIKCFLGLAIERKQTEVVVLNLEHLVLDRAAQTPITQLYVFKGVLFRACREMGIPMPRFLLERTDDKLDLRIFLRRESFAKNNVVPLRGAAARKARI